MGFSLSDLNPMSVVSNVIQSVSHELLPKNLQFLGDVAALGVDYQSGNWLKGLGDVQKFLADLPQSAPTSDGQAGAGHGTGDPTAPQHSEPSPPSWYRGSTVAVAAAAVNTVAQAVRGGPPTTNAPTANTSAPTTAPATAPSTQAPPAQPAQSPAAATSAPATSSPAAAPASTSSSSTSVVPDDPFFGLSDADLMNKVVSGQVPESISKDPAKMQQLQARMNQISEMNQLISQMMAAIHDMHRQVIQNIRA